MKRAYKLTLSFILSCTMLTGCNNIGSSEASIVSVATGSTYLPYDIDKTGIINRFYANNDNSINIDIPSTYSIDVQGRIISGDAYQVKGISEYCFANNNLIKTVNIPENVTTIGEKAFYNCPNLERINVHSYISSIGENAFENCNKLTKIVSNGDTGIILSENDNLKEFAIPSTVIELGDFVFNGWDELSSLTINESIVKIGNNSISNNLKLSSVNIKSQLDLLGDNVFDNCSHLKSIGKSGSSGINFLKTPKISKLIIPPSVISMDSQMFYDWDKLQEISIPDSITSLNDVFKGNSSLKKITCSINMILNMFNYRSEKNLIHDETMYTVQYGTVPGWTYNKYYYIPKTLTEIHILNGEELKDACFYGMTSIKSVYLPSTVTSFGKGSFTECTNLTDVHIQTDYDWVYTTNYYNYETLSQSLVNNPTAFASALKEHNSSAYYWYAKKSN